MEAIGRIMKGIIVFEYPIFIVMREATLKYLQIEESTVGLGDWDDIK